MLFASLNNAVQEKKISTTATKCNNDNDEDNVMMDKI